MGQTVSSIKKFLLSYILHVGGLVLIITGVLQGSTRIGVILIITGIWVGIFGIFTRRVLKKSPPK